MSFLRVEAIARYNMQSRAQVTHWALNKCSLDWFWKIAKLAKGWLEASATNYVALVWRLPYMQTAQLKQDSSVSINLPAINAPSLKPWKVALNINYHGQALCQGLDRHHSSLNCKATLRYSFLKIKRQRGKLPKAKHKVIKSGFNSKAHSYLLSAAGFLQISMPFVLTGILEEPGFDEKEFNSPGSTTNKLFKI